MKNDNRQNIVEQATFLFRKKGYTATSISDITKACGVTKGALYYHFPNKEQLALESMGQVRDFFVREVFVASQPEKITAIKSLTVFNDKIETFFAHNKDGCLLANLTLELGASYELFRCEILAFFELWERSYYYLFLNFFSEDESKTRASDTLANIQGCILMYRASGNLDLLKRQHLNVLKVCMKG